MKVLKKILVLALLKIITNVNAQCNNNSIYVNFNKGDNILRIKTSFSETFAIDKRLWLSDNQYTKVKPFFLVEIFRGDVKLKPTYLDILITPEEGVSNMSQNKDFIKTSDEYIFILTTNENKQILIDRLNSSDSVAYFDLKKGERYSLYVNLIRDSDVFTRSNKIEFTY